jgi:dienelactone hydrolase
MAGNVQEWCWNGAGDGKRYVLGGAWDGGYAWFTGDAAQAAIYREKNTGFRCVKNLPGQAPPKEAFEEVKRPVRDFLAVKPFNDLQFQIVKGLYAYDKTKPLKAVVERREETASWVHERVAVDAAYGTERLIIHLFLPKESAPPYQPVLYWPSGGGLVRAVVSPMDEYLAFLIKSGRALVCPAYKGTYERKTQPPGAAVGQWEHFVQQANDLSRSIDYLETRPKDFDAAAIGYYGVSWGATSTVRAVAVEDRIKAAVLADGGLPATPFERPERDPVHYLPRITIPVLMLNGKYDAGYPPKEAQEPMFQLLGTALDRKKYRLFYSSHVAAPSPERIQETVSWFDSYLGPVTPKSGPGESSK